ncbi:hypothetical protein N0V91_004327 [Didymella pomorum]|uniref:Uncharacterized protein n=1 Tax=Didymella pomorum TaxID=749634 RepID=A0A9W8ZF32_9PLEO|nr:hypothetical protein N0V91_004327 [Didymella pomorum]
MSDTTKVTQLRAAYETNYAQAKESRRLNDHEVHQNLEKVSDMSAFLELPEWNFDSDVFISGAFLDEWWARHKIAEKVGVQMKPWQESLDKFKKSLDEIERDLDEIEEDLKEIDEEMARCREQNSDVETAEDDDSNDDLVRHYNGDSADDTIFRILEILELRDYLGIRIQDTTHYEGVKISVRDINANSDSGDDIPLAAWEVFNDANEGLNVERWQDWYGLVQPDTFLTLRPRNSNLDV